MPRAGPAQASHLFPCLEERECNSGRETILENLTYVGVLGKGTSADGNFLNHMTVRLQRYYYYPDNGGDMYSPGINHNGTAAEQRPWTNRWMVVKEGGYVA